jgi:hypothetical protein
MNPGAHPATANAKIAATPVCNFVRFIPVSHGHSAIAGVIKFTPADESILMETKPSLNKPEMSSR